MRGLVTYTDWLVVCTGQTPRQSKSIAEEVRKRLKEEFGRMPRRPEGEREAEWILLDFLDIVVHIFTPQAREFYRLDRLCREAPPTGIDTAAGTGRRRRAVFPPRGPPPHSSP